MKQAHKIKIELMDEANEKVEYSLQFLKSFSYSRSILEMCSSISFDVSKSNVGLMPSVLPYDDSNGQRIKTIQALTPGRMVKAYVDDHQIFFGYVIAVESSVSNTDDSLKIKCKDVMWRLDNTTLFTNRVQAGNQQIGKIVEYALEGLQAIGPTGKPNGFLPNDIFNKNLIIFTQQEFIKTVSGKTSDADLMSEAESVKAKDVKAKDNESIYSYIKRLLQPHGFIMQADSLGNIIIFRPNIEDQPRFTFVNNWKKNKTFTDASLPMLGTPSLRIDLDKVHCNYFIYGNSVASDEGRSMVYAIYENPDVPVNKTNGKPLVVNNLFHKDTNLKTKSACEKFAKRKAGFENANMYNYDFSVAGMGIGKLLFSNDVVVNIDDDINGEHRPVYVKSIEFSATPNEQTTKFSACLTSALLLE